MRQSEKATIAQHALYGSQWLLFLMILEVATVLPNATAVLTPFTMADSVNHFTALYSHLRSFGATVGKSYKPERYAPYYSSGV